MSSIEILSKNREAYVKLAEISPLFDTMVPLDKYRLLGENIRIVQTFEHGIMFTKEYSHAVYYWTNDELLQEINDAIKRTPNTSVIKEGWYKIAYKKK